MLNCQTFKQKIEELREDLIKKARYLENLLLEYKNTGSEEIAKEIDRILKEIEEFDSSKIEEFKKEYEAKVKELMVEWYPKKYFINMKNEFLQNIKINEKGRIEIKKLSISYCNLSHSLYLPSLFERIEVLDCSYNILTSLPELPDGLEELNCRNNQLTSLPELPDSLIKLECDGNPLTKETIEKTQSHPNYEPRTWVI
jgi:Leucine-rich repeat (LRR) protein